jgi:hypothetical protein
MSVRNFPMIRIGEGPVATKRSPTETQWANSWPASEAEVRHRADKMRNMIVTLVIAGLWAAVIVALIANR